MQVTTCWTEELGLEQTLLILKSLAHDHFQNGGETGLLLSELLASEDWSGLVNFDLDYHEHWNVSQLIACRQGLAFFQKLEAIDIGVDKTSVAISKFLESEVACRETNGFLKHTERNSTLCATPFVARLLEAARRKIRIVLGVCPKADNLRFHFGPGATTDLTKRLSCPTEKFAAGFTCSTNMYSSGLLPTYLRAVPHWLHAFESDEQEVDGYTVTTVPVKLTPGRLVCVPKSAKTYRTIMIEPSLNGFVQQGIRHAMERRLASAGLSTRDQSRNARLAREGSITRALATIDLSSASDLISYNLVKRLLPDDWFKLLCSARTGAVELPTGEVLPLEKFSSMGNAFTFPLETLIFWAVSTAALDVSGVQYTFDQIAVYGDDIIVPSCGYQHVKLGLEVLGFQLNAAKSYATGPFRESCGHDYYMGIDIRPYYQKQLISGRSLFTMHNHFFRVYENITANKIMGFIPEPLRIFGPDGYGDGHLLGEWVPKRSLKLARKGYCGVSFDTFSLRPVKKISRFPGDYVSPLYSVYVSGRVRMHELVPLEVVPSVIEFARDGRPYWTFPGDDGYKRISIYTLDPR